MSVYLGVREKRHSHKKQITFNQPVSRVADLAASMAVRTAT